MDRITAGERSRIMSKIKSKDTKAELDLSKALWSTGFRFRVCYGSEKIDIAFPRQKVAVFVDGCFWHSCPAHGHIPKSNTSYWGWKLEKKRSAQPRKT